MIVKGLVSVVIATYNNGNFLPLAVKSVLDQTYPHLEINVVDDGSIDNTSRIMEQFKNEERVKYFRQTNQGQAKAKNKGIKEACGEYVAFLDGDDLWSPTKLEVQLPCFNHSAKIGVVYTNVTHIDEEGTVLGSPDRKHYSGNISGKLLVDNFVTGMASIVRKGCFETVGLFDESLPMGIDYDLWLRISAHYDFFFLDKVTYFYRQWDGQMSHNYKKRMECAIHIMTKFLEQNPGLVNAGMVNKAWAHTYVSKGKGIAQFENNKKLAAYDFLHALQFKPFYFPAWKQLATLFFPNVTYGLTRLKNLMRNH